MKQDLDINIPKMTSQDLKTDDWQKDASGNEFKQDESGVRLYRMTPVDSVVPLGQYFKTNLYEKYRYANVVHFRTSFDELSKDEEDQLKKIQKYAIGYVKKYQQIKDDGKGYYLFSKQPGSGKSMIACCILNDLSQNHEVTTQAISTIDFFKRLKWTFNEEDKSEEAVLNPILAVDVLLFDDCGSERHSEWVDEQLYHVIDSRLNAGKPTFFTSNYSIDELPYHSRIKSRINAVTAQIPMPERDVRAMINGEKKKAFIGKITDESESQKGK